jgi:general L-amino acid transport system substrate-binding protein
LLDVEAQSACNHKIVKITAARGTCSGINPDIEPSAKTTQGISMKLKTLALALGATLSLGAAAASATTLETVKARGQLVCGSSTGLAGFGTPNDKGEWSGFDVDYCRAIAAAIFGDPTKVKFVPLAAKDRFTSLASGDIDVLVRNTTWTMSRDSQGMDFPATTFYDGQGFMVKKAANVTSALGLSGATVCVQQGTTTELVLADYFRANNLPLQAVTFATSDETRQAYDSGRCDAFTTDASGLYAERLKLTNPDENVVLPEIVSKEPLGPAVRHGDNQWGDIVRWVHFALLTAEEDGVTQANVDEKMKSDNPDIKRLLGTEGEFGKGIGLENDWAVKMIKAVGNYSEIFERNVGQGSPLKIERGVNALWSKKGLQYAPPIR